jgi:hypothetical protein
MAKKTSSVDRVVKPGRMACPKCDRIFKLQLACPHCGRRVSPRDVAGDPHLQLRFIWKVNQRTRLLRKMPLEFAALWVGKSAERRRMFIAARGLPADFQLPAAPAQRRAPRRTQKRIAAEELAVRLSEDDLEAILNKALGLPAPRIKKANREE